MATITVNAETYTVRGPQTFYIRPSGTIYGNSDGTTYNDAWSGFSAVPKNELIAGDTLYICGEHNEMFDITGIHGELNNTTKIRFDYASDLGSINGSVSIPSVDFSVHSGNVYVATNVKQSDVTAYSATAPSNPNVGDIWYYTGSQGFANPMKVNLYKYSGTVWEEYSRAFVKSNQLFIDKKRQPVSRYPKDSVFTGVTIDTVGPPAGTSSNVTGLNAYNDADIVGGRYVVRPRNFGLEERYIESKSGSVITHGQLWWGGINPSAVNPSPGCYIEGVPILCVEHGQWCYWNDAIYVYLDSAPSNYEIKYSNIQHGIFGQNNSYVEILEGTIKNTNNSAIQLEYCENCTVNNNVFTNIYVAESSWWPYSGAVNIRSTDWADCTINDIDPYNTPLDNEKLNIDVTNNLFVNIYGGNAAIHYYAVNGGNITGNKIINVGANVYENKAQSNHTRLWACRNIVDDTNIMSNVAYAGLEAYSSNFSFDGNILSNFNLFFTDAGGYHGWSHTHTANNNIIFNCLGNIDYAVYSANAGLYCDDSSYNVTFDGNIVFQNDYTDGATTFGVWSNATGSGKVATNNYVYQDNGQYIDGSVPSRDFDTVSGNTTGLMPAFDPETIPGV